MPKIETDGLSGTEFVRLANLPARQADSLLEWLPEAYLRKAGTEENQPGYCVAYEDYEFWMEHFFSGAASLPEDQI